MNKFECYCCGACCRNLDQDETYNFLDRGDGICKHLNLSRNLCRIYRDRPLVCRVDEMYFQKFHQLMEKDYYYKLNYHACRRLRKKMNCQ